MYKTLFELRESIKKVSRVANVKFLMLLLFFLFFNLRNLTLEKRIGAGLKRFSKNIVGMKPLISLLRTLGWKVIISKMRENIKLPQVIFPIGLHFSFTGNQGTGKSLAGKRMASVLWQMGYTRMNRLTLATRDILVGKFMGHTAPKTKAVIDGAIGGVLFLDNASCLLKKDNPRDFGSESLEILLQYMESYRNDLVVIFAGYTEKIKDFLTANPGLQSRVTYHVDFPDYSLSELETIFQIGLKRVNYRVTHGSACLLRKYLEKKKHETNFTNGRTVENMMTSLETIHSTQLKKINPMTEVTLRHLVTIKPIDVATFLLKKGIC